jgi:hypothetical protein
MDGIDDLVPGASRPLQGNNGQGPVKGVSNTCHVSQRCLHFDEIRRDVTTSKAREPVKAAGIHTVVPMYEGAGFVVSRSS